MRKALTILIATPIVLGGLAGCASNQGTLDEYAVTRNAPLIIPPDYTLEPPRAGTVSTSAGEAQAQALQALFGGPAPRSASERAVLSDASDGEPPIDARSMAGDPETRVVDKGANTTQILTTPAGNGDTASADTPQ